MIPGKYTIQIIRGGTFSINVDGEDAAGNPLDFAVYDKIRIQMKASWDKRASASAIYEISLATGHITLANGNQSIVIVIPAAETARLKFDEAVYELELITDAVVDPAADEVVDKLLAGPVTIAGDMI